jgi:cyclophilin family peptidyl-prolyl cis-trans isomerase
MRKFLKRMFTVLAVTAILSGTTQVTIQSAEIGPKVRLTTTLGDIVLLLYPKDAPKTVDNFLKYVRDGFYDGTVFHRILQGYIIQGGGYTLRLQSKPTRAPIKNEADNGLKNKIGTIAMARTKDPHSATSQFFFNIQDNENLDHRSKTPGGWGYCVFGEVTEGLRVLYKISNTPTGSAGPFQRDVPRIPIIIKKATLETP